MNVTKFLDAIGAATVVLLLHAASADAQLFRTWVSSGGSDSNPCSRTQPCRTFNGAQAKTNANGEINCVDSGDYPKIVITKPITIDCADTPAAIGSGAEQTLVDVNVSEASYPNAVVRLRHLAINQGGVVGIAVLVRGGGAEVHIENCRIAGAASFAVAFMPVANLELFIRDTFIGGVGGTAVLVQSGTGGARASLNNVRLDRNARGVAALKRGVANAFVFLEDVQIEGSTGTAIASDGAGAIVYLSNSTVAHSNVVFAATNNGQIISFGNNTIGANANFGSTPTLFQQR
jgi:hypothetical protein